MSVLCLVPPSVAAQNALLAGRREPGHRLTKVLLASYGLHAGALVALYRQPPPECGTGAVCMPEPGPAGLDLAMTEIEAVLPLAELPAPVEPHTPSVTQGPRHAATPAVPTRTVSADRRQTSAANGTVPGPQGATGASSEAGRGIGGNLGTGWYANRIRDILAARFVSPYVTSARPPVPFDASVHFSILPDGEVAGPIVGLTSGHAEWDRAALRAVDGARLPPPPDDLARDRLAVEITFHFEPLR